EHRAAERDALKKVVDAFHAALQSRHGKAALQDLKARLGPTSAEDVTPHRAACNAVDEFLRKADAGSAESEEQADRSMRTYAAFVERQYDVAVRHSRQKAGY